MNWLSRLNPRTWFGQPVKRDLTFEQFAALGLTQQPADAQAAPVTRETALGIGAVFCADRVISDDISTFPKRIYEGEPDDEKAKWIPGHPIAQLLAKPSGADPTGPTAPVFWSAFQHNANIWGYGIAEIVRNGYGEPVQLALIPTPQSRLERTAGRLRFFGPGPGGQQVELPPDDVLFVPGHTPDGSTGFKLLHVARQAFGLAIAAQRYGTGRFAKGLNPAGVIEHPGKLDEETHNNMRSSWRALYAGLNGIGVPLILEEGSKWTPFEFDHNDQLQLVQLADWLVDEVARFFNVSPVKLHKLGRATWSNLETLNRDHVHTCLGPWLARHEAEIAAKLLPPGFHCRHVTDRLLRADTPQRIDALTKGIAGGIYTPNEARATEDLPPVDGGDLLLRPANLVPADPAKAPKLPAPTPPTPTPTEPANGTDTPKPAE